MQQICSKYVANRLVFTFPFFYMPVKSVGIEHVHGRAAQCLYIFFQLIKPDSFDIIIIEEIGVGRWGKLNPANYADNPAN